MTRWALGIIGLAGALGVALELAGVHSAVRTALVLLFLATAPTAAVAGLLRTVDALARLVIACTTTIVLLALTAIIMLSEGIWSPTGGLLAVVGVTAACATAQVPAVRQRFTAKTATWRMAVQSRLALSNGQALSTHSGSLDRFLAGIRVRTDSPTRYRYRHDRQLLEELSAKPSSWSPVPREVLEHVFRGEGEPRQPPVFTRGDGVALLYPRCLNLFTGESESCKTWASLLAVAQEIRKGNVVCIIDFEDSADTTIDRLRQLGLTEAQITDGIVYCSPDSPFDIVAQAHLERHLGNLCNSSNRKLTLAVVDSVNEAMLIEGLDPDVGGDTARFYRGLPRWLKDRGPAVLLIEHTTKGGDSRSRGASASERAINGLDGAAYSFVEMSPFGAGVAGKVRVSVSKDRGGFIREHAPAKVVGTLLLSSSAQDGSVSASFAPPPGRRSASRQIPSKPSE